MNSHFRTRAIAVAMSTILLAALVPAATAAAATTTPVSRPQVVTAALSGYSPCGLHDNYHAYYASTAVTLKDVSWTHTPSKFHLTADASGTVSITHSQTFTASATITAGIKGDASVIFASAEASAGVSLTALGTVTDSTTITLSVVNHKSSDQHYVMYDGIQEAIGSWTEYQCQYVSNMAEYLWKSVGSGYWDSWVVQLYGVLNCADRTSIIKEYGSWNVEGAAAASC